jgi:hypothetical protein
MKGEQPKTQVEKRKMKKKILAIDVGIKNLSFCLMELDGNYSKQNTNQSQKRCHVVDWENMCTLDPKTNSKKVPLESLTESILYTLNDRFTDDYEADVVYIENQPATKNRTMKTVSVVIYTYFNMLKIMFGNVKKVQFSSASNKLKVSKRFSESLRHCPQGTYAQRKKLAVELTKLYLFEFEMQDKNTNIKNNNNNNNNENDVGKYEWFLKQRKKDDLSDAFLLAMYHAEK